MSTVTTRRRPPGSFAQPKPAGGVLSDVETPPAAKPARKRKKKDESEGEPSPTGKQRKSRKPKDNQPPEEKRVNESGRTVRFSNTPNQKTRERIQRALGVGVGAYGAIAHRLFLIDSGELIPTARGGPSQEFTVLGATGNDCQKGNLCKHILFVMLRVLKLGQDNPLVWQKALLTHEVEEVLEKGPASNLDRAVLANEAVRRQWHTMTGKTTGDDAQVEEAAAEDSSTSRRKPVEGSDCPICYEDITDSTEELVWCSTCGTNIHKDCQNKWISTKRSQHNTVTCVYCRSPWVDGSCPTAAAGAPGSSQPGSHGGFTNLAQFSSAHRNADTSYEALYGERAAWMRRR